MAFPETLLWTSMGAYLVAWFAVLIGSIFSRPRLRKISYTLASLGLAVQTYALVTRWLAVGHPPLFGTFENSEAAAWILVGFSLILAISSKRLRFLGTATYIWAAGLMGFGMLFNKDRIPLTISERSVWVDMHVVFAWLAFGSFLMAWAIAFKILRKPAQALSGWVKDRMLKFLLLGFITYTVMIALGSVYEFFLFGKWWQWDLVETISLITWVYYGIIIHTRLFYPQRERLAAWLVVFAPIGLLASYFFLVLLPGRSFHVFDLPF